MFRLSCLRVSLWHEQQRGGIELIAARALEITKEAEEGGGGREKRGGGGGGGGEEEAGNEIGNSFSLLCSAVSTM